MEVQVTISGGRITAVDATALPTGGRSGRISDAVAPVLASETLTAQSASIDSGATYTSEAYAQSLQAALDKAAAAVIGLTGTMTENTITAPARRPVPLPRTWSIGGAFQRARAMVPWAHRTPNGGMYPLVPGWQG